MSLHDDDHVSSASDSNSAVIQSEVPFESLSYYKQGKYLEEHGKDGLTLIRAFICYNKAMRDGSRLAKDRLGELSQIYVHVYGIFRELDPLDDKLSEMLRKKQYEKAVNYCEKQILKDPVFAYYAAIICRDYIKSDSDRFEVYFHRVKSINFSIDQAVSQLKINGNGQITLQRRSKKSKKLKYVDYFEPRVKRQDIFNERLRYIQGHEMNRR